jgi:hypothetical protein
MLNRCFLWAALFLNMSERNFNNGSPQRPMATFLNRAHTIKITQLFMAKGSNPTAGLTLLWARNPFRGNFNHWQVSRLLRVMKHYSPVGRRNHDRPLKRLLGTWDRNGSTSGPTPWKIYDDDDGCNWTGLGQSLCLQLEVLGLYFYRFGKMNGKSHFWEKGSVINCWETDTSACRTRLASRGLD